MDIKNICIVAFAAVVCANACADVTKLKTVTMVTNLVYDTELELGEKILIKEEVIVKDNIGRSSRAFFRPQASVSFSCSILGVLNISGSASRRIEIITPGQPQWKERHDVYNKNWGSERTDTTEWQAAYAHEMDHWNSFNAFFHSCIC